MHEFARPHDNGVLMEREPTPLSKCLPWHFLRAARVIHNIIISCSALAGFMCITDRFNWRMASLYFPSVPIKYSWSLSEVRWLPQSQHYDDLGIEQHIMSR